MTKEEKKEYMKKYREKNKERILEQQRQYKEKNKERILEQQRQYKEKNKELLRVKNSEYYKSHRQERIKYSRKHRLNNLKKVSQVSLAYKKKKMQEDPKFKLMCSLRNRLNVAIKQSSKAGSAVSDLGCSVDYLKKHFESLFSGSMSWDNWGKVWQQDHIYPLSAARLEDRTEFLAVNNWRNLQPLTVKDNLLKGDIVTPAAQELFDSLCSELV